MVPGETSPVDYIQHGALGLVALIIGIFMIKWVPALGAFVREQFNSLATAIRESSTTVTKTLDEHGRRQDSGINEIKALIRTVESKTDQHAANLTHQISQINGRVPNDSHRAP